jgi:hypothetical protein
MECDFTSFWNDPNNIYSWYLSAYPFLLSIYPDKPSMDSLQIYYLISMNNRNLTPQPEIANCYYLLFSYFLANYPIEGTPAQFQGKTWLEYTWQNLPSAINTTGVQITTGLNTAISNILGLNIWELLIIALVVILLFNKFL